MKLGKTIFIPILLCSAHAPAADPGTQFRVALMDFDTEAGLYQHELEVKDLSAAVQAAVGREGRFDLVEREQLAVATRELGLSILTGGGDDAKAQVGKWVKADVLVIGRVPRDEARGSTLNLEILDLDHADVLAKRAMSLPSGTNRAPLLSQAPAIAREVIGLLEEALLTHQRRKGQTSVALFSLQRVEDRFGAGFRDQGVAHTLGLFPDAFARAFEKEVVTNSSIRLIQFPRANRAIEEAELVLAGLAQTDSDAWKKLADIYIWADLTATNLPARYWGGPNPKSTLALTTYIWDGRGEPKLIREGPLPLNGGGWTDQDVTALCERVARQVLAAGKSNSKPPFDNDVRQKLSQMMVERADRLSAPGFMAWPDSPEHRRQLGELIRDLEIACFFDPQNRVAQEKLVSTRWGRMVEQYARDPFRFAWRASEVSKRCSC